MNKKGAFLSLSSSILPNRRVEVKFGGVGTLAYTGGHSLYAHRGFGKGY